LTGTTNGSGAATVTSNALVGKLYAVDVDLSACDATCDATLSTIGADGAQTLLTLTDSQLNGMLHPRHLVHDQTGAALTGTSGGDRAAPLMDGIPQLAIVQGGATKAFRMTLYIED
jgi:hypothetical protein